MKKNLLCCLLLFCLVSPFAATILNQTYTGQNIYNNATFSNATASVNGTSLILSGISSGGPYVLANMPILGAGILAPNSSATVRVIVNFTWLTNYDCDPYFMISDGTNTAGIEIWDNNSGGFGIYSAAHSSTSTFSGFVMHTQSNGTGFPTSGSSSTVQFTVNINASAAASIDVSFFSTNQSSATTRTLNGNAGLRFLIGNDVNDSSYRVDSVNFLITGTSAVPEPGTLFLALCGLSLLFLKKL